MPIEHFPGKRAVRYVDQRMGTVRKFIAWELAKLKALHEAGATEAERTRLKDGLLATINEIYARKDFWVIKSKAPYSLYYDAIAESLFQARNSSSEPAAYLRDVDGLIAQNDLAYGSASRREFEKFLARHDGLMG
jgi:hypothetical protein